MKAETHVLRWLGLVVLLAAAPIQAAERKVYFFGNSLIHHLSDSDETAVPHWLAQMARAAGHGFRADGQWGFLRDFTGPGSPQANWSFGAVRTAWEPGRPFDAVGWDAIVVNPANFIQGAAPDTPYGGDNPDGASPVSALLALIDAHRGVPVLIYEGWAEMRSGFPPGRRAFRRYNAYNMGDYHDWYVALKEALQQARPDRDIRLIPVARMLSEMLTEGPIAGIDPEKLYVDADPHGTATLYLLAATIVYSALYGEPAPVGLELPDSIAPEVQRAYPLLAITIASRLKAEKWAALETGERRQAATTDPETGTAAARAAGGAAGLVDPALAVGLNGISDWSTQQPFVDIMKAARPWLGHEPGAWGAWDAARLQQGGFLDPNGWVRAMPPGVDRIESFVLTDQNAAATAMAGRYLVRWQGAGTLRLGGRAQRVRYGDNEAWFHYVPGEGEVAITITATDPERRGDHIREIEIVREDQLPLQALGVTFNPDWVARIADFRVLRFMDWMLTNGSPVTGWEGRPRLDDFSWAWRGVPAEAMIDLANQVGADAWFCLPHGADDGYSRALAEMVRDRLDPRLKVFVEFSNELWNFTFPQARWAAEQARARWGAAAGDDAWMQFAGLRSAAAMRVWSEVFAGAGTARLVRVAAVHTGWIGLEEAFFAAPLAVAEGEAAPAEAFDAYAVTGYFGFELGDAEEGRLKDLQRWIAESRDAAMAAARAEGLQRRALEAAVAPVRFDLAVPRAAEAVRRGSLTELTETLWPYHAEAARRHGLRLIMYEGGSHAVGHGAASDDEELAAFFAVFNYSDAMASLYRDALRAWQDVGGQAFNAFVDVAAPSRHGSWGALRHLQDDNPRWRAIETANAAGTAGGEGRAPGTFLQGVLRRGADSDAVLVGTAEEDILLGGVGDDVLVAAGGSDFLDGGAGDDVARLPGGPDDYRFVSEPGRLVALRGREEVRLRGIEFLEFEATPGRRFRLEPAE